MLVKSGFMRVHLLVLEKQAWDCIVDLNSTLHAVIPQHHWRVRHNQVPAYSFFEEAGVQFSAIGQQSSCLQHTNSRSNLVAKFLCPVVLLGHMDIHYQVNWYSYLFGKKCNVSLNSDCDFIGYIITNPLSLTQSWAYLFPQVDGFVWASKVSAKETLLILLYHSILLLV